MKRLITGARKLTIYYGAIMAVAVMISLIGGLRLVWSQDPAPETKQGKTAAVLIVPGSTSNAGEVIFKADADHDGMTDEDEAANGTDPNDASDADGDNDGDGVTNGDEVAGGSGVNNADSDGDGVTDGEEIRLGYNPADSSSTPPVGVTLVALQVTPNPAGLVINSLLGQQPVQLTVTGLLSDASTVDLTSAANTVYESTDPSVALVDSLGRVAGISTGTATISVVNGARSTQATINVVSFSPSLMSFLQLAGQANNVDVSGDFAYVAVGNAGIQIVDVSDRRAPHIVSTLDTSGNANDIRIVGNLAYVADGSAGLQIVDVSNPASPYLRGTIDTPGDAQDVVVYGPRAYVADGTAGLQIINVSDPAAPVVVRTVDTAGTAAGVDIAGNLAVVADRFPASGLRIIDITTEVDAQIVGTLSMPSNVEDLVTRDSLAYCAGASNGLLIVDFSVPSLPRLLGQHTSNETGFFTPNDVALTGNFVLAAETRFANSVPIDDVSDPSDPRYRGSLDYTTTGNHDGTGIALDPSYAYTTAISGSLSRLYIGQYQAVDVAGIAPTVSLTSPSAGLTFMEGQPIDLAAIAADDIGVAGVQFKGNGNISGPLQTTAPYQLKFFVPNGISSLTLTATAFDMGANATVSQPVTVNVVPDPGTTVIGRVVDRLNQPMSNATVKVFGSYSTVTGADGRFSFYAPSVLGDHIQVMVTAERDGQPFSGLSASVPLVVAGVTNLGDVLAKPTGQIAFVRMHTDVFANSEIHVMDANGENQTRLTFNAFREHTPIFSPDGLKIAFNRDNSCGRNVYVMNADGSNQISISPGDSYVWSPDSRKLAYAFNSSIYISNSDGSGKRVLTAIGSSYYPVAWSPDGTKLAYVGRESNASDLYTINADGSNRQKLTNTLASKYEVAWSPDGAWIAFIQNDGASRYKVYAVHPDGSGLIKLTTQDIFYYDLAWMPDSNRLVCVFHFNLGSSIYLLDVNGAAPARVTNNGFVYDWGPAPSADGVKIAFASDEGLYIVNSDGSEQRQLSINDWDPNFRPEVIPVQDPGTTVTGRILDEAGQPVSNATVKLFGQTIANSGTDGTFSVTGVSALKGNLTVIASAASGGRVASGFSTAVVPVTAGLTQLGDVRIAQKIAFVSERDGNPEIYLMDADGSNQVRVTSTEVTESRPSLSPDKTKIAFATNKDGHDEIYFMNLDGSNPFRVSYLQSNCIGNSDPEWSPDGTKIVFTGRVNAAENADIFVVNSDATNLRRLTSNSAWDYMPSWLPDGSRIMFVSYRDNAYGEIYVMNADGTNQTRLTSNTIPEREPTWSPDNTKIAFSSLRDSLDSIFVINVDGSNELRVTTDAASNDYPAWSHDGTRILYSSNGDGNYELYVINVDGTNRLRLTVDTFDDLQPDW